MFLVPNLPWSNSYHYRILVLISQLGLVILNNCLHEVLSLRILSITVLESGLGAHPIVKLLVII